MTPTAPHRRILGAVLAGGRSTRFGSDKALAMLDGRPLIDHATAAIARHADHVIICGGDRSGFPGIPDRPAPGQGPLGGLNSALHHAMEHGYDAVLTTGCDMPDFPDAAAQALFAAGTAVLKGHHLIGLWPASLAPLLDWHLAETPDRSLFAWIARAGAGTVTVPDLHLPNINSAEDLTALARDRQP